MKTLVFALALFLSISACSSPKEDNTSAENNTSNIEDNGGQPVFQEINISKQIGDCEDYSGKSGCLDVKITYPELINGSDSLNTSVNYLVIEYLSDFLASEKIVPAESLRPYIQGLLEAKAQQIETDTTTYLDVLDLEVNVFVKYMNETITCLEHSYYVYSGGAHPNSGAGYFILNNRTGELLGKDEIIDADSDFKNLMLSQIKEAMELTADQDLSAAGYFVTDEEFSINDNIGVTADSLMITYVPYEIAPYVMGYTYLNFSKEEVLPLLREEFKDKWTE